MDPTQASQTLHKVLSDYLDAVAAQRSLPAPDLAPHFVKLDSLEIELAPWLDPRIRHFMESKSYRKAHDYLTALLSSKLVNPTENRQSCSR